MPVTSATPIPAIEAQAGASRLEGIIDLLEGAAFRTAQQCAGGEIGQTQSPVALGRFDLGSECVGAEATQADRRSAAHGTRCC